MRPDRAGAVAWAGVVASAHNADPATVRAIAANVLTALRALHAEGLAHGQLDASCILVSETEAVRPRTVGAR